MTIYNISITSPNTTHLYPVKASIGEPAYTYEQCIPSEAEGIAVLRYIPTVAEIVAGEYYANNTALKSYNKCTVQCTVVDVPLVNIYLSADGLTNWFYVGKSISTAGIIDFKVLPSDFPAGSSFFVKVEDIASPTVFDIVEGHIYSTITIDTLPTETPLATNFSANGKANCAFVDVTFSSATGEVEYTIAVVNGVWTRSDLQLLTADGFVPNQLISVMVKDSNDALSYVEEADAFNSLATVTLDAITGTFTAGVAKGLSGGTNGASLNVYYRIHVEPPTEPNAWTLAGAGTVDEGAGTWTYSLTIAVAGTYDVKVVDSVDASALALQENITVASSWSFVTLNLTATGTGRAYAGMALSGTKLSVFGGYNASGNVAENNTATADESSLTSWSAGITGHPQNNQFGYGSIGSDIMSICGSQGSGGGSTSNISNAGNPTTPTNWMGLPDIGYAKMAMAVVCYNNKLFVIGGTIGGIYYNQVSKYESGSWTTVRADNALNGFTKVSNACACADLSGNLYLLGGQNLSGCTNEVWKSTDQGVSWTKLTQVGTGFGSRAFAVGWFSSGYIYILGGSDGTNAISTMYRSSDGMTWEEVIISNGDWSARFAMASCTASDGKQYIYGGRYGSTFYDQLFKVG